MISKVFGAQAPAAYSVVVGSLRRYSVVEKRSYPIVEAADRAISRLVTAFLLTVERVKQQIPMDELEAALVARDLGGAWQVLNVEERMAKVAQGAGLQPQETSLLEALQKTFQEGAQAELQVLGRVPVRKAKKDKKPPKPPLGSFGSVGAAMGFDLLSPEAIAFLSQYTFELIREVSDETRSAVQEVVLEAFRVGGHPYKQARTIRNVIGLTARQTGAVENFRRMLESGNLREALTRALRDHRFDSTLQRAVREQVPLSQEQIDRMVKRYYERYLKYRAENIARTETLRASHAGQRETWRQAIRQRLLLEETKQKWVVTPDDRLCERCRPIPGMNEEGVPIDGSFATPDGPSIGPPLHPHCRCTAVLMEESL